MSKASVVRMGWMVLYRAGIKAKSGFLIDFQGKGDDTNTIYVVNFKAVRRAIAMLWLLRD